MCGIIGIFNKEEHDKLAIKGLESIRYRGIDGLNYMHEKDFSLGHALHSVVSFVKQPIKDKGILIANCEIYNWKELNAKYSLKADNDADALLRLLDKKGIDKIKEILDELDGTYAFAYKKDNLVIIARDILGIKPLWYSHADGFCFASEKKALEKISLLSITELNPRKIAIYDLKEDKLKLLERDFFDIRPEHKDSKEEIKKILSEKIESAVQKRIPDRKVAVLLSGGIDSSFLTLLLKKFGCNLTAYVAGFSSSTMQEADDIRYAKKAAQSLDIRLKIITIKEEEIEKCLKKIVPLIEDSNVVKVGVALPFFVACQQAKKDGCKVIFSGLGSEEIFAGYQRHKDSLDINKECVSGLLKMYERDLYRDDIITMYNNLELRLPFLDKELVKYSLKIPAKYKISDKQSKIIIREVAESYGLDKDIAQRKKKAAQYGSNFHKALKKLSKNKGYSRISEYLLQFYPQKNVKLAALVSGGKDSIFAMYTMMKQNYDIRCMVTLKSRNEDSYMFHTPAISMVKLQSESTNIPLIEQSTEGEKEKELEDLKKALEKAKERYHVEGVVTGALFSNYQRERIEKIADELSLKIFSPLWHINQETEMREIIDEGFSVIFTKVAADGLNKQWLNKIITKEDIDKLAKLNEKIGMNVAGEGGEFESLVIDGPIFDKRINISDYEVDEENKCTATLIIKSAELIDR